MGNVVSSLLMYALQAAWFCQRLIDQDYRQNHGSRSKPIVDIDETDLDVFLSKCRSYYLSKSHQIEYGKPEKESTEVKWKWNHSRSDSKWRDDEVADVPQKATNCGSTDSAAHGQEGGTVPLGSDYACLDSDKESVLSRMDQQLVLRDADLSEILMANHKNVDILLSKRCELSKGHGSRFDSERIPSHKIDSPKTERWKRKKLYYRKRFNPRMVPDRSVDYPHSPWKASSLADFSSKDFDSEQIDLTSPDDSLNSDKEDFLYEFEREQMSDTRAAALGADRGESLPGADGSDRGVFHEDSHRSEKTAHCDLNGSRGGGCPDGNVCLPMEMSQDVDPNSVVAMKNGNATSIPSCLE